APVRRPSEADLHGVSVQRIPSAPSMLLPANAPLVPDVSSAGISAKQSKATPVSRWKNGKEHRGRHGRPILRLPHAIVELARIVTAVGGVSKQHGLNHTLIYASGGSLPSFTN